MGEVVILSAKRTPIGKYKGSLAAVSAVELGETAVKAAVKAANIPHGEIDQVIFGHVLSGGNKQNVARQIALNSGLGYEVPATTINDVCGSSMKAIQLACQAIKLGDADVIVVGGTENMSQAAKVQQYDYQQEEWQEPVSSMIHDGLTDAFSGQHMGLTAENIAERYHITRESQDHYAFETQKKAAAAAKTGLFNDEIVPVSLPNGEQLSADEGIRFDTTLEKLNSLKPVFKENGTVTAGNASTLNDGAAALVLASKSFAESHGLDYLAEVDGYTEVGVDPAIMGTAPLKAIGQLVEKARLSLDDIDLFEINDSFAAASVLVQRELAIPDDKLNIYGGAIALGHPIGATGTRIVTTLLSELKQTGQQRGIASLCVGGGQGLALLLSIPQKPTDKKFYQMSQVERLDQLVADQKITSEERGLLLKKEALPEDIADHLIENRISEFALPMGVVPKFVINGEEKFIPMVTEEPSVVAAASHAGKIIGQAGGFQTVEVSRQMMGQIVLMNVKDDQAMMKKIESDKAELFATAEAAYPSIVKRGGGVREIMTRSFTRDRYLSIDFFIDVQDAMGANIVNTILEACSETIRRWFPEEEILFSILSNHAIRSVVKASCRLPLTSLQKGGFSGITTAQKIVAAADYARIDQFRAVTHNKGIMNGVDAVVLATGNDTRAVEAACHAYATRSGRYQGLTNWRIDGDELVGEIELPLALGIVGGATKVLPKAQASLALLNVRSAGELAQIVAAVGLAQNFAALRALVTEGIQKGHMAMQMRSLALSAGAEGAEIEALAEKLRQVKPANLETAEALLAEMRAVQ